MRIRPSRLDAITQTPGDILVTIRESHPMRSLWCDILVMISERRKTRSVLSSWSNESPDTIKGFEDTKRSRM